jgi:hypothetical protein
MPSGAKTSHENGMQTLYRNLPFVFSGTYEIGCRKKGKGITSKVERVFPRSIRKGNLT